MQATGFLNSATSQVGIDRWPELHEIAMGNDVLLQHPTQWHKFQGSDALSHRDSTPFYVQDDSGRYEDISQEIGLTHQYAGRGVAVADVDGTGHLDFAIANQWGTSEFYKNAGTSEGAALTLKLLLPTSSSGAQFRVANSALGQMQGSPAIGACASVRLPGGKLLTEQVDGGNGHSGKNSFELHFGLGEQSAAMQYPVELKWRGRDGQRHTRTLTLDAGRYSVLLGE